MGRGWRVDVKRDACKREDVMCYMGGVLVKNYLEWESGVSESIKGDLLWEIQVYRLGLFASDVGWRDVTKLQNDRRTVKLSDQLYRALGSISANIAEGFSRSSLKDQVRFFEYALG
jgi:hypothetical protein